MAVRYFETREEREAALARLKEAGWHTWEWRRMNLFVLQADLTQAEMDKILDDKEEGEDNGRC